MLFLGKVVSLLLNDHKVSNLNIKRAFDLHLQQTSCIDPHFYFRSEISTGLDWLGGGYPFQPSPRPQHDWKCESQSEDDWEEEDAGCDKNHNNLTSWGESLHCDTNTNKTCSFNSFCDGFLDQTTSRTQRDQGPSTSECKIHCYCKFISML